MAACSFGARFVSAVLMFLAIPLSMAFSDDQVESVLSSWERQRATFKALKASYRGKSVVDKGYYEDPSGKGGGFPERQTEIDIDGHVLIDLGNKRVKIRTLSQLPLFGLDGGAVWKPVDRTMYYNGDVFTKVEPPSSNTPKDMQEMQAVDVEIQEGQRGLRVFELEVFPILWAAGVVGLRFADDVHFLETPFEKSDLVVESTTELAGVECLVLRSTPFARNLHFDEFWVEKSAHNRIHRMTRYYIIEGEEKVLFQIENQFQKDEGAAPSEWLITRRLIGQSPISETRVALREFTDEVRPGADEFEFTPLPGMTVVDRRLPLDARMFVANEAGKPALPLEEHSMLMDSAQRRWRFYAGSAAVVVLVGGAVVLWRRRVS